MSRYQFCNEVFLTYDETGYHVLIGNEKTDESYYTSEQLKNPLVAYQRFMNTINNHFFKKIDEYINKTNRNRGMGCNNKSLDCCIDCIKSGFNITHDSNCYLTMQQAMNLIQGSNR